jgi:diguanylate cyclase (GGDEF)-like protein
MFIIEVDEEKNALILLKANDEEHFNYLNKHYNTFEAMNFIIAPLIKDVIILKNLNENVLKDQITGFYNRKYLDKYLKDKSFFKNKDTKIAFMLVEVDRFKAVIDEFDYEIGDDVLIELAKVLNKVIKKEDIIIKLTGYEFLVILTNTDDTVAQNIAQNMIKEFASVEVTVNMFTGQTLKKTICVGYSIYPADSEDINKVIKDADIALQEAKNLGRGQYLRYTPEKESIIDLF